MNLGLDFYESVLIINACKRGVEDSIIKILSIMQ